MKKFKASHVVVFKYRCLSENVSQKIPKGRQKFKLSSDNLFLLFRLFHL